MKQFSNISKQFAVITLIIISILGGIGYRAHASNKTNQSANHDAYFPLIMKEANPAAMSPALASTLTPTATETTTIATTTAATKSPNHCETAVDFLYVIDKSGSMAWEFPGGTIKMDVVKNALLTVNQDIYNANFNNRAGLVTYTTDDDSLTDDDTFLTIVTDTIPLTSTVSSLNTIIETMEPIGGTPTGAALEAARQLMLQADHAGRQLVIIHLTDGVPTVDKQGKYYPDTYVQDIKVYDANGNPFEPDFVETTGTTPAGQLYYSDKPAGYVVAEIMRESLDLKQALPEAIVHGFAIQGAGFNTEVVKYVAETGGGNFYSINDTDSLKNELRQIFYDTSGCPEPTSTPTNTPGPSPTATNTAMPTTATNTAMPTNTPTPTATNTTMPTNTPTPTLTPTPSGPYIVLNPDCSTYSITITGYNWPIDYDIDLFWDTSLIDTIDDSEHEGTFSRTIPCNRDQSGLHTVVAETQSGPARVTQDIFISCSGSTPPPIPPIPTIGPSPTLEPTPSLTGKDLVMVDSPELITQPIQGSISLDFNVRITNIGDSDIDEQFFVDLYIDPTVMFTTYIPISQSVGFTAVAGLPMGASKVLTITVPFGFNGLPGPHTVYGMVDSLDGQNGGQINESNETNNISSPLTITDDYFYPTPTPSSTPDSSGTQTISGIVQARFDQWVPQQRADVYLFENITNQRIDTQLTDANGFYSFDNVPDGTYSVIACLRNTDYYGIRTGITPPNPLSNIYMLPNSGGCTLPDG